MSLALMAVMAELPDSAMLFVRYKIFSRPAVRTKAVPARSDRDGRIRVRLEHHHRLCLRVSPFLLAYLRQERLEFQVWVRYEVGGEGGRATERLLGSASLELAPLCVPARREHRLVRTVPLFKRGVNSMGGARMAVRVAISSASEALDGVSTSTFNF